MRPPAESSLRAGLRDGYGVRVDRLELEVAGADVNAWTWRLLADDGRRLFLKLRREVRPAAILVPRFLRTIGFDEVVAPIPTLAGAASLAINGWTAVLTDEIEGVTAVGDTLDLDGWRRLGEFSARLHAVELPTEVRAHVPVERFSDSWIELARSVDARIDRLDPAALDDESGAVRERWLAERPIIRRIVALSGELGRRIRGRSTPPTNVLCHADFHGANLLVDGAGRFHVVDWDEVCLAPRERDLMFVRGSVVAGAVRDDQADAFEAGYGPVEVDRELLAWYRIDWAVQDVAGYAVEVLFEPDREPPNRPRARRIFEGLFGAGDEVDGALAIAAELGLVRGSSYGTLPSGA